MRNYGDDNDGSGGGGADGEFLGIVLACIGGIALIALAIYCYCECKKYFAEEEDEKMRKKRITKAVMEAELQYVDNFG